MPSLHADPARRYELTERQRVVLELIGRGYTNAQIAERLDISLDGAKYHVREILGKLGVESREAAATEWRRSRSPAARVGHAWAALTGLAWPWRLVGAGILAVAGVAVAVLALHLSGDGDEHGGALPAGSSSPTPAPGGQATPTPTPTPTGTLGFVPPTLPAPCKPTDVALSLAVEPRGQELRLRLIAQGTTACRLEGPGSLRLIRPPLDPPPALPPFANMERTFTVHAIFPFSGVFAEWRWTNWCGSEAAVHLWEARAGVAGDEARAQLAVTTFPACQDTAAPTSLTVVAAPQLSDELATIETCGGQAPGWLCEFALRVERDLQAGRVEQVIGGALISSFFCGPNGQVRGFDYSDLCKGAREGDVRNGYPLALRGSEGGPVSQADLVARLSPLVGPNSGSYLAAIGCATDSRGCSSFVLVFSVQTQPGVQPPSAAYLAFQLARGIEPGVIGAGLSGDNAADLLNGGVTMTQMGEASISRFRRR